MRELIFQIDAFTSKVFSGNPAAVIPLNKWLDDSLLQSIAQENNVSETAFFVPAEKIYHIRWFTPLAEVDLCGHATLAAAFVIFNYLEKKSTEILFSSRSGDLRVYKDQDLLSMDFPSQPPKPCSMPDDLVEGLGQEPLEILCSEDYFAVFSTEKDIRSLNPDMERLNRLGLRGVIVTAKGDEADFVSRFFAPKFGINEDPVTGSAHCALIPYWSHTLGKDTLYAQQVSKRSGELYCKDQGDRVIISGKAVKYMEGTIRI
ncbi:MAG: PhzF family phenazine biosynthesis protein [bacterium]